MNLKESMRRRMRGHAQDVEINLTSVMNIFLILIPFLLLTAVFVRISVLELSLPSLDSSSRSAQVKKQKTAIINILMIDGNGFELKSPEMKFALITKKDDNYDWDKLVTQLKEIKTKYPDSEDILISAVDSIKYQIIISVMDKCRESGFPNISISG